MRNRSSDPLLRILLGSVLVLMLALGSQARAGDDEEDEAPFEEKLIKGLLGADKASIDYRERSPLVVPPTSALPPPEAGKAVADPAWPKDADIQQRVKKVRQRQKFDSNRDWGNALRPDQLGGGRGAAGSGSVGVPTGRESDERASGRPLSPSELGTRGNIFGKLFSSSSNSTETAVFPGEPERQTLTDPPPGYMTPSPNYPYGLLPSHEAPKAATLDDRAVGRKD